MFARYDRMAKQFTRIGKDIAIAVKGRWPRPQYESHSPSGSSEREGRQYAQG
jgi:hypothetical protein